MGVLKRSLCFLKEKNWVSQCHFHRILNTTDRPQSKMIILSMNVDKNP